jgi:serine/threonine protein kinase
VKNIGARERELYQTEVSSLLKLQDTVHVAALLDCGIRENLPWLVSRLIQGQDLRKHLLINGPLSQSQWLKLADNLFRALKVAHSHQVVHRDVTPANVLFADGDDIFVLIDFGLAVFEDVFFEGAVAGARTLSSVGRGAGTLPYQAPEQVGLNPVSDSDLFAAGVVLYEAATGVNPWVQKLGIDIEEIEETDPEILNLILDGEPTFDGLGEDQSRFLKRLLMKDPYERLSADMALAIVTAWQRTGVLDLGYYGSSFDVMELEPDPEESPIFHEMSMGAPTDFDSAVVELSAESKPTIKKMQGEKSGFEHRSGKSKDWSQIEKLVRSYFDELPDSDFSAVIALKEMGSLGITGLQSDGTIRIDFKIYGNFISWKLLESTLAEKVQVLDPTGRADLILPEVGGVQFLASKILDVLKASFGDTPPEIRIY